jgi:anaerobic selenocysteine-containing dehydrogenase
MRDTIGASIGPDPEDAGLAELIVVWGQNPLSTNLHSWRFVRGRPTVVIDAFRTRTARRADRFVQIRPGTDAALALAMARVMITEGLHDGEFVAAHTTGFDAFAAAADEWPAERAAALTGVPAETIEGLAREFAAARPLLIKSGYGLTRHANGGTMLRALACLATLTGSWRRPGGGLLVSTSGHHHKNPSALQRPDLLPTPRPRTINMVLLAEALDPARTADPPVTAMVVYAANPAAVTPDQEGILRGLTRDDLFTVVHEHFVTDTARYADVLLPATTQLEHLDVMTAWGHRHIQLNRPAIEPQGEALPNTELFRRLAAAMGFDEPCFTDSDEDLARQAIRWDRAGTTLDELATGRPHRSPSQAAPCAEGYPAPGGRFRFAGRHGDDPPRHVDLPHTGSPTALRLLSPSGHHFLNSSMANTERVRRADGEPFVVLHPDDAAARGLAEDQQVRVHNETGSFVAKLRISDDAVAGTAWTPTTRWAGDHPGSRGVNAVVPEGLTDIGNGPVFYDAQVEVSWA